MPRIHINVSENLLRILDLLVESKLYKNRTELITEALLNYQPVKRLWEKEQARLIEQVTKAIEQTTEKLEMDVLAETVKKLKEASK